ncbi:MAG: NAD(P)H-dependent oxidoreductase [Geobacteraceae bacterium]|nr:NAD(P)H-dependent oxidoreductase [Geobacteraceae bacterium]
MKKLLHIIATPRGEESRTLQVSGAFLRAFAAQHPDCLVETLNLFEAELPPLAANQVDGKYALMGGKDLTGDLALAWKNILRFIEQFLSADAYLLSVPMWNFGVPYILKHYLDVIAQPRYLFRYTAAGPEGLVKDRKMAVITSRGGDYSADPAKALDHQEPYLRAIFNLVGITDLTFIHAQPMDAAGPAVQKDRVRDASAAAERLAAGF